MIFQGFSVSLNTSSSILQWILTIYSGRVNLPLRVIFVLDIPGFVLGAILVVLTWFISIISGISAGNIFPYFHEHNMGSKFGTIPFSGIMVK